MKERNKLSLYRDEKYKMKFILIVIFMIKI